MSHFDEKAARENSSGNPTFITGARWQHSQDAAKIAELGNQLEIERMRLAGCSVAALGYFDGCNDEYNSASLQDVLALRTKADQQAAKIAELEAEVEKTKQDMHLVVSSAGKDLIAERDQLAEKLRTAVEVLEWFAYERLYSMASFVTAAPVFDLENPHNIVVVS